MKNVQKIDLGLTGYDELFMNDAERQENKLPRIYDVPISEIDDFPDHPFKVKVDEDMDQLVQSIKERGIITPVTLRPKEDGRYGKVLKDTFSAIRLPSRTSTTEPSSKNNLIPRLPKPLHLRLCRN